MIRHGILSGCAIALLSACGGSGGGSSLDVSESDDIIALAELVARDALLDDLVNDDDAPLEVTPFEDLPTSGVVSYTGLTFVGLPDTSIEGFNAVGSATFEADFDDQTITGSADNFFQGEGMDIGDSATFNGERIDGSLAFELEQAFDNVNGYLGEATGSLTSLNGEDIAVDVPIGGSFSGTEAEALLIINTGGDLDLSSSAIAD